MTRDDSPVARDAWAAEDARFWRPSELLVDLASRGERFAALNPSADGR